MKKRKIFIWMTLFLFVFFILKASGKTENYIIKNIEYLPMLDGYCAMTALRMNLEYYGFSTDTSLILNLGWNYGFIYIKTPFFTVAYPDTDPVEEIVYASHLLGFKAKVLTHKSLEEAKISLVKYISMDKPVIVQWIPHTVLAYGYRKNGNLIIYHDPGSPTNDLIAFSLRTNLIGKGKGTQMDIAEWQKIPFLWNMRKFQIVVVEPDERKVKIDWKSIWKRNARKTLGLIKNPYPAQYGITGIKEMIKDLENISFQSNKELSDYLSRHNITFKLGVGFRRNASSFLAGQASLLKNRNLMQASIAFRESAHLFREGMILINQWLKKHPEQAEEGKKVLIDILERIVISEEKGAKFLLESAK